MDLHHSISAVGVKILLPDDSNPTLPHFHQSYTYTAYDPDVLGYQPYVTSTAYLFAPTALWGYRVGTTETEYQPTWQQ